MIVLWLLILRGISIELRSHLYLQVWRAFFDASLQLLQRAARHLLRSRARQRHPRRPARRRRHFFLPLWTNWRVSPTPGILDWYTVIGGVLSLIALAAHGSLYLAVKTSDALQTRARAILRLLWAPLVVFTTISLIATMSIRPHTLTELHRAPHRLHHSLRSRALSRWHVSFLAH